MRTKNISYSFLKVYTKKKTELNYWKCIEKLKRLMKYLSCLSVMRMVGLVFLEVARVSIRKLLMFVNVTKAVNRMSRGTLEETLSLIDANDTEYIGELYRLHCECRVLRNIE